MSRISPISADLSPWATSTQGLWVSTTWVAQSYPSLLHRARAVFQQVGRALSPDDADAIEQDLLPLLSSSPGAGAFELSALREYTGRLRRARPGAGLERLELAMVALDATNRFIAGNPLVEAVDVMKWQRVPLEHAGFAVDLGLLARLWRIGQNDVPWAAKRQVTTGLGRVVAIAQRVAGVMGDLDWPRELHRATHELGARWMGGGWKYLLEILGRLPQTEPRNLAIYEALADEADADSRAPVEHSIAVFVETLGSSRLAASTALRAAIRRVVSGDEEGAFERGKEALERMRAVGDPLGACSAAVLLGWIRRHDASETARWIEHALGWARGHETPELQLRLLYTLGLECRKAGEDIGQRRAFEEARKLVADHPAALTMEDQLDLLYALGLERRRAGDDLGQLRTFEEACKLAPDYPGVLEELWAIWEGKHEPARNDPEAPEHEARKPPTRTEAASLPPALQQIGNQIDECALMAAYEALGAHIGELLEDHDDDAVVHMLLGHIELLDGDQTTELRLLRAWLCAAVTDLVEDDHELWCTSKALQLDLEDHVGVAEEQMVMAWARPDRRLTVLEERFGLVWLDLRSTLDPRARALQCIAEAKHAMQQGQGQRARFWVDRAQRYRTRMEEA